MQPTCHPASNRPPIKKFSNSTVSTSENDFISVKKKCNLRLLWYSKNLQALETRTTVLQFSVNILHSKKLEWAYLNETKFFILFKQSFYFILFKPSFIIYIAPCTKGIYN